jgi:hypothetical protein
VLANEVIDFAHVVPRHAVQRARPALSERGMVYVAARVVNATNADPPAPLGVGHRERIAVPSTPDAS